MTGSGNDFVFFDARSASGTSSGEASRIARICDRRAGVGADGVVYLEAAEAPESFRMSYYNSDGSRASMCGNAALCSTRLATELGAASPGGFSFASDSGVVHARMRGGLPEVELSAIQRLTPVAQVSVEAGEERIGFAVAGVPHVVVLCADVDAVALDTRGASLRHDRSLGGQGANANFVSPGTSGGWRMRTFERGVEAETLACGTGAVACAALLRAWTLEGPGAETVLITRSGRELRVSFGDGGPGSSIPSLCGEGRIVFTGELREL